MTNCIDNTHKRAFHWESRKIRKAGIKGGWRKRLASCRRLWDGVK